VVSGSALSIETLNGTLEHAERSEGIDLGLRVILGSKQACVSASDFRPETITEMAQRAVAMAREAPDDPSVGLASVDQLAQNWDVEALELCDPANEPSPKELENDALIAEDAAQCVKGVAQVQGSSAGYSSRDIHIAGSNGFDGGYRRTSRSVSCVAISGEGLGMERDYAGEGRVFQSDLPDAASIGRLAGERAAARFNSRRPPTGAYPVLFDERISSSLIGHIMSAINGAAIVRGASWLRDAMDTRILPAELSLTEDPLRVRISGSKPFDAEGLATQRRLIVDKGVLKTWTLDLASARRLGLNSTGNAAKGTSSPPTPSAGNLALTQGTASREDLIETMGTGLLVTSMIGATINPNTGDYSRGATGFWIQNGEITVPVNECTIAGNLHEMLRTLVPANDARAHLSRTVPSLLVEGLTIAGV